MENPGTFRITEPCHENWDRMTPESQGRFCAACQRCVFDFTDKSQTDIARAYAATQGDMCGRVKVSDLTMARPAVRGRYSLRGRGLKSLQLFALALMTAFTFLFSVPVQAQKPVLMGKVAYVATPSEVSGRVRWDTGMPAAAVQVELLHDGTVIASTTTDTDGRYHMTTRMTGAMEVVVSAGHGVRTNQVLQLEADQKAKADFTLFDRVIMGGISARPPDVIQQVPRKPVSKPQKPHVARVKPVPPNVEPLDGAAVEDLAIARVAVDGFELTVWPNPTPDILYLHAETAGSKSLTWELYDLSGRLLDGGDWDTGMVRRKPIDLSALSAGTYLLHLQSGTKSMIHKVLKQ